MTKSSQLKGGGRCWYLSSKILTDSECSKRQMGSWLSSKALVRIWIQLPALQIWRHPRVPLLPHILLFFASEEKLDYWKKRLCFLFLYLSHPRPARSELKWRFGWCKTQIKTQITGVENVLASWKLIGMKVMGRQFACWGENVGFKRSQSNSRENPKIPELRLYRGCVWNKKGPCCCLECFPS